MSSYCKYDFHLTVCLLEFFSSSLLSYPLTKASISLLFEETTFNSASLPQRAEQDICVVESGLGVKLGDTDTSSER